MTDSAASITLSAVRQRVRAAKADGWYGYDDEAQADVRFLLRELDAAKHEARYWRSLTHVSLGGQRV